MLLSRGVGGLGRGSDNAGDEGAVSPTQSQPDNDELWESKKGAPEEENLQLNFKIAGQHDGHIPGGHCPRQRGVSRGPLEDTMFEQRETVMMRNKISGVSGHGETAF